jgi:hypothetical protein
MFWAFIALLGTIGLALLYLLIWPFRMMLKRGRGASSEAGAQPSDPAPKGTDAAAGPR